MPNYSDGKIYAIRSHQTDKVYIGSTTQLLSKRFYEHKKSYERYIKDQKKAYITSFEMFKYNDCYIELIKNYPCKNKEELSKEEGALIRKMNCVNKKIAGRTLKEYYDENRVQYNEKMKLYYRDPEKKNIQKEYASEVIICNICNTEMIKSSWTSHCKTKKHLERSAAPPLEQHSCTQSDFSSDEALRSSDEEVDYDDGMKKHPPKGWRLKKPRLEPIVKVTFPKDDWFYCIFCNKVKKNASGCMVDLKKGSKVIQIKVCRGCGATTSNVARPRGE